MGCSSSRDANVYRPEPEEATAGEVLGISLSAVLKFAEPISHDLTTSQVVETVLKSHTSATESYLDVLPQEEKGQPTFFVSHRWEAPFHSTLQAVCLHAGVEKADDEAAKKLFVWMDVFCINQHTLGQGQLSSVVGLKGAIMSSQQTLLCLDPEGEVLSRLWCLFEVLTAAQTVGSARLHILADTVDQAALHQAYHGIDFNTAAATFETDRINILAKLGATPPRIAAATDTIKNALLDSTAAEATAADAAAGERPLAAAGSLSKHSHMLELVGSLAEAEVLARRALELREGALGKEHVDVAISLTDLAHLLQEQANHNEAEALLRRALKLQEKLLGKDHVETAITSEQLAFSLMFQQRYAEAERLYRDLLERFARNGLEEHVAVAVVLSGLGQAIGHQGRWDNEVESLQRRALAIRSKLLGSDNPETLDSQAAVAEVLYQQRRMPEAEALSRKTLDMRRKVLGNDHLSVAESLVNLADILEANTKYDEAEKMYHEAKEIRRRLLGPMHADVAMSLMDIAKVLECQWRDDEAEPYYRDALAMRLNLYGPEHLDVAASQIALADLLVGMDRFPEAEDLYRQALKIREKALGRGHPDWADALSNLEAVLKSQAKREEAEALRHQPATPMSKKVSRKLSSSSIGSQPGTRPGSTSSFGSTRNIFRDARWGEHLMSARDLSLWVVKEEDLPQVKEGGWKLL